MHTRSIWHYVQYERDNMLNQIGSIIGKVRHSFSITNDNKEKVNLSIIVDFTSTPDSDITNWLCSNRVIAGQRPWRSLVRSRTEPMR